jgi:hypothetical protein
MGILDEAIREHLELKRQHGAGESELKELEDDAFGPPGRPGDEDAASEAPTEFMAQPEVDEAPPASEEEPAGERAAEQVSTEATRRREPAPEIADLQEGPPAEEPAVEETPAMEHEAIRPSEADEQEEASLQEEPEEAPSGPSTEERQAIADQPTELYDVAGEEFADSAAPAPSEDELVEEEISEPRLAAVDAVIDDDDEVEKPAVADDEGEEDDFFDEKRLSDELNQALEAPGEAAEGDASQPEEEEASDAPTPRGPDEDLLEETPDFLEGTPEDDELWFEQKPPKDFDFDD